MWTKHSRFRKCSLCNVRLSPCLALFIHVDRGESGIDDNDLPVVSRVTRLKGQMHHEPVLQPIDLRTWLRYDHLLKIFRKKPFAVGCTHLHSRFTCFYEILKTSTKQQRKLWKFEKRKVETSFGLLYHTVPINSSRRLLLRARGSRFMKHGWLGLENRARASRNS